MVLAAPGTGHVLVSYAPPAVTNPRSSIFQGREFDGFYSILGEPQVFPGGNCEPCPEAKCFIMTEY